MTNQSNSHKALSPKKLSVKKSAKQTDQETWEKYSSFHDSFTELLSYENSRKANADIWQLNYI